MRGEREGQRQRITKAGGEGAFIVLDRTGALAMPFNTEGMNRGYVTPDGKRHVAIYKDLSLEYPTPQIHRNSPSHLKTLKYGGCNLRMDATGHSRLSPPDLIRTGPCVGKPRRGPMPSVRHRDLEYQLTCMGANSRFGRTKMLSTTNAVANPHLKGFIAAITSRGGISYHFSSVTSR